MEYLYRYQPFNNFDAIFCDEVITFKSPSSFNDPFDCRTLVSSDSTAEERKRFLEDLRDNPSDESLKDDLTKTIDEFIDSDLHLNKDKFLTGSIRKCNTWRIGRLAGTLGGYGKTIRADEFARAGQDN